MYCRRLLDKEDAEDVMVETFTALWNDKEKMESPEHVKNFLYQVAQRKAFILRKKNKHKGLPLLESVISMQAEEVNNIEEHEMLVQVLIKAILDRADALPPQCRQVFKYYLANMPAAEIAEKMGINANAVYDHCANAKQKIRAALKKKGIGLTIS